MRDIDRKHAQTNIYGIKLVRKRSDFLYEKYDFETS